MQRCWKSTLHVMSGRAPLDSCSFDLSFDLASVGRYLGVEMPIVIHQAGTAVVVDCTDLDGK